MVARVIFAAFHPLRFFRPRFTRIGFLRPRFAPSNGNRTGSLVEGVMSQAFDIERLVVKRQPAAQN
jgi:hypothetical protein